MAQARLFFSRRYAAMRPDAPAKRGLIHTCGRLIRLPAVAIALWFSALPSQAQDPAALAGKRIVFLGDSITQDGKYVGFAEYYLNRLHPEKNFDIIGLGLSSETVSGLSEQGHAGGRFPRPHLFERLGRLLEKAKPEVVFACYGINDGIYQPLDEARFAAFREGVARLVSECKAAGVKRIILVTPPIYDDPADGKPEYDGVMAAYAAWLTKMELPDVQVIDLHSAMRAARDQRDTPFSKDRVHPDEEGHLFMARTILAGIGVQAPDEPLAEIHADPLFRKVDLMRKARSAGWMKHVGYTREKTVAPQRLGDTEDVVAAMRAEIDTLRRSTPGRTP